MISVAAAQRLCLAQVRALGVENVRLDDALGRVLAASMGATRPQPPFDAAAMDGYAICAADARAGAALHVAGESAAGLGWDGTVSPGMACRIFTGAPVPAGAVRVILQEDVARNADTITLTELSSGTNIRPQGADFAADYQLDPYRVLGPSDLALLAALGHGTIPVIRKPTIAILATGDELVLPGETARPDQIYASNIFALAALVRHAGGTPLLLPIAGDSTQALHTAFDSAEAAAADLLVTVGGASVGDHDLVAGVAQARGVDLAFHKIAMRPGKPLMAGTGAAGAFLGLPGNPVSAIVCGHLFLVPMIKTFLGLADVLPHGISARLTDPVDANGPRAHYMRAHFTESTDGRVVTPHDRQDSSLLTVLAEANCLLVRPEGAGPQAAGEPVTILPI